MRSIARLVVLLLSAPTAALAQEKPDEAPKPGSGVEQMGYYIGTWEGRGETGGGVLGDAGKLSSKMTCEWFAGGFQVVCRGEEQGPSGTWAFLNIKSYEESSNSYTEYSISSLGEIEYTLGGVLTGNKLTYLLMQDTDGKSAKIRYSETRLSPVSMTNLAEVSIDGGPWQEMARGQINKVGS